MPRYLANASIATSGATYQFIEAEGVRYSHILDPATGMGVTGRRIVSVVARSGADADALASAVSVLDLDRARNVVRTYAVGARIIVPGDAPIDVGQLPNKAPETPPDATCGPAG